MKKGVLLINLGSPKAPSKKQVGRYLRQFLGDRHVISLPFFPRWLLVNGIIVPFRASRSARMYRSIWTPEGAPLLVYAKAFLKKVKAGLEKKGIDVPVELGMRYGEPSIRTAVHRLLEKNTEDLLVIPLYPHYARATYESALAEVEKTLSRYANKPSLRIVPPFYDHGDYQAALERSFRETVTGNRIDRLVFSFHGIPLAHLPCLQETAKACNENPGKHIGRYESCLNCYRYQCYRTAELLTGRIGGDRNAYAVAFQSKMGKGEWLKPCLFEVLSELPKQGDKNIAVMAPSFTADCLETLQELDMEARNAFLSAGGTNFLRVPCLNDQDLWAKKMSKWIGEWHEKSLDGKIL